jgi:hypothetical protein
MDFFSLVVFVLSGRGLCDGPIPRPEESYRLWRVSQCDREASIVTKPWLLGGCRNTKGNIYSKLATNIGRRYEVAQLVEALRLKPEGRDFDSRWYHCNFSLLNPSGRTMAPGSTQPLTEISTKDIS